MKKRSRHLAKEAAIRVKQMRQDLNLTPQEMAARLDITPSCYYKSERGEQFFTVTSLHILSEKYGISMDWLMFDKGPKRVADRNKLETLEKILEQKNIEHENELKQLQEQLQEEKNKNSQLKQDFQNEKKQLEANLKTDVKELLDEIDNDSTFYHELMLYFKKYQKERTGKQ